MTVEAEYDVLVLGAGGAGMRAAIAAAQAGCRVGVVCKSLLGKAHTVMAEGGIAAALGNLDESDSWEVHFGDTLRGGAMLNNWRMVELYAHEVIDRVVELEEWGGVFDRTKAGKISQRAFGAHSWRRLAHIGDRTGLELIRTCQDRLVHTEGVTVHMETTLTRLLKDGDRIAGGFGYQRATGEFVLIRAKAVVLATGGWGRMFLITSNSWEGTGDGAAMAYAAGAELKDMEFMQFHPTGMVWPPGARGILVTEAVRGEGGILRNRVGERFMARYDPIKKDLSSRDVVARSIFKEVQAGRGSPHGGAFLDVTHLGAETIRRRLPSMYEQFHSLAGVDITKEPMEVAPTIHYTMGGVNVEAETAATSVPGLYAAGEVAAGLHGANRLGGNSLGDILVFGKRAGEAAAEYARSRKLLPRVRQADVEAERELLLRPLSGGKGEDPFHLHRALQNAMQSGAAIARTEDSLRDTLEEILELQERAKRIRVPGTPAYNPGFSGARDDLFMLTVSEAIVRSGLERRESRGSQWRLDFPERDPELGHVNLVTRLGKDGRMEVVRTALTPMPENLRKLTEGETRVAATAIADAAEAKLQAKLKGQPAPKVVTSPEDERPTKLRIAYEDGSTDRHVKFKVWRGDASGGNLEQFSVPQIEGMVVLDAIHWIQANGTADLACRWNCKAGKCGSCSAEINGRPSLMCKTRVDEVLETATEVSVRPMQVFPTIEDLVTDVSWNYQVNQRIQPFTPAPGVHAPFVMFQPDIERVSEQRRCIECFLCQDVCHVLREHEGSKRFFGPRFMVRLASLEMHPKDVANRIPQLHGEAGIALCNITKCCTEVCPEHIKITDNSIIPLKERVADRHFDPIRGAISLLRPARSKENPPPQGGDGSLA
ncbi:MAG TPA: succinate dehydrogenase/fumarate reductase iron-sulfur subunit [Candidatus Dormibacteraeota bacterium]|nr:succinate dehydrogenase/fumarate reductase iron-sulfur subunit [Candidatus Dormibacteraeota bacterium]